MSLARQFAAVGQGSTAAFEEDNVRNIRTGNWFKAKISPISDISLNEALGIDPRASVTFYIRDRRQLGQILAGDTLEAIGSQFVVLPKNAPDNPASLHLEYHAMKLETGKDQQS